MPTHPERHIARQMTDRNGRNLDGAYVRSKTLTERVLSLR